MLECGVGGNGHLHQATLFYFTNNLVTYYIVSGGSLGSPKLQKLLCQLKLLEFSLGIILIVVHIPSTHMINQWTDGLRHGICLASSQMKCSSTAEVWQIFEGVPVALATLLWPQELIQPMQQHAFVHFHNSHA